MSYRVPKDLPKIDATWQPWPIEDRLRAAMQRDDAPVWARLSAVAITLNEQPGSIPVNNCCGIMSQGEFDPWGWTAPDAWKHGKPIGYALLNEGQGIKGAPFLAFARIEDSLNFLIDRCVARNIRDGDTYAARWIGLQLSDLHYSGAINNYRACYDKAVAALWQMAARAVQ